MTWASKPAVWRTIGRGRLVAVAATTCFADITESNYAAHCGAGADELSRFMWQMNATIRKPVREARNHLQWRGIR